MQSDGLIKVDRHRSCAKTVGPNHWDVSMYGSISKCFSMIWVPMNGGIDVQSCQVMA